MGGDSCAYWVFQSIYVLQNSNIQWFAGAVLSNMAATGYVWWLTFQLKKIKKFSSSLTPAAFRVLCSHKQLLAMVLVSAEHFRLWRMFTWPAPGGATFLPSSVSRSRVYATNPIQLNYLMASREKSLSKYTSLGSTLDLLNQNLWEGKGWESWESFNKYPQMAIRQTHISGSALQGKPEVE